MTPGEPGAERPGDGARGSWKLLAGVLAGGVLVVFLYHIASLVGAFARLEAAFDRGAVWTILFMIAVTFGTLAVIGGGLAASLRGEEATAEGADEPDERGGPEAGRP